MLWWSVVAHAVQPFAVQTVDAVSGAPVPCVELRTTNEIRWVSDDNGAIAIVEPGLMGEDVWVHVSASGHGVDADFFGYEGTVLALREGGFARIELERRGTPAPCTAGDAHSRRLADGYPDPGGLYRAEVVDADTGRPVPLVALVSPEATYTSDSSGNLAVDHPDHLGTLVTFTIASHGYHHPAGQVTLDAQPGAHDVIEVERDMVAERLYRVTGQGIHRDTVLLGLTPPTAEPVLNARVMGQDSALTVPLDGELFWLWGDTNKASYPLGLFATAGGRSPLGGLDPALGVDLTYETGGDGFVRAMAPISTDGPVWLTALSVVDDAGVDTPVATFGVFDGLVAMGRGVAVYDPASQTFEARSALPDWMPDVPHGEGLPWNGHVLLPHGYRTAATVDAFVAPEQWEAWSPFLPGTPLAVDRDTDGRAVYAWRTGGVPALPEHVDSGLLAPDDAWFGHTRDPMTGEPVEVHNRSVIFSPWRQRFVQLFTEVGGDSYLGEQWLSEADTPLGPWVYARKIITHDRYTLYNPQLHPELSPDPRHLRLEGTYTTFFSGAPAPTPRYDYNQLMFEVDLEHPDLVMPVAVYDVSGDGTELSTAPHLAPDATVSAAAWYALDRPTTDDALAVWRSGPDCEESVFEVGTQPPVPPAFWMRSPDAYGIGLVDLVLATAVDGTPGLFLADAVPSDWSVDGPPLGRVWPNPVDSDVPVQDYRGPVWVEAGPDRCVEVASGDEAALTLDGSASVGTDGASWSWAVDGQQVGAAPQVAVTLPEGLHTAVLTVTTDEGVVYEDALWVQVTGVAPTSTEPATTDGPATSGGSAKDSEGCGCSTGATTTGTGWCLLLGLLLRRRNRHGTDAGDGAPWRSTGGCWWWRSRAGAVARYSHLFADSAMSPRLVLKQILPAGASSWMALMSVSNTSNDPGSTLTPPPIRMQSYASLRSSALTSASAVSAEVTRHHLAS